MLLPGAGTKQLGICSLQYYVGIYGEGGEGGNSLALGAKSEGL